LCDGDRLALDRSDKKFHWLSLSVVHQPLSGEAALSCGDDGVDDPCRWLWSQRSSFGSNEAAPEAWRDTEGLEESLRDGLLVMVLLFDHRRSAV
jgi:hypothetical protein